MNNRPAPPIIGTKGLIRVIKLVSGLFSDSPADVDGFFPVATSLLLLTLLDSTITGPQPVLPITVPGTPGLLVLGCVAILVAGSLQRVRAARHS